MGSGNQVDLFEDSPEAKRPSRVRNAEEAEETEDIARLNDPPERAQQAELFGPPRVGAAAVPRDLYTTATSVPGRVFLGASSWSFPGWKGTVYDSSYDDITLSRHGLTAYSQHPLLRAVCIDRTYYTPLSVRELAAYREQTHTDFRFLVKAHRALTVPRVRETGAPNPRFMDPTYATDAVVGPYVEGLRGKGGALVFQFAAHDFASTPSALHFFLDHLHRFLSGLPKGPTYAVELRNQHQLTRGYASVLEDVGACHVLSVIDTMPDLIRQGRAAEAGDSPKLIVRWNLHRKHNYGAAKTRYAPFDKIVDADPPRRHRIADLCLDWAQRGRECIVTVNNKAEGSAPLSVFGLAEAIVQREKYLH